VSEQCEYGVHHREHRQHAGERGSEVFREVRNRQHQHRALVALPQHGDQEARRRTPQPADLALAAERHLLAQRARHRQAGEGVDEALRGGGRHGGAERLGSGGADARAGAVGSPPAAGALPSVQAGWPPARGLHCLPCRRCRACSWMTRPGSCAGLQACNAKVW
jgi:hypothetical protein